MNMISLDCCGIHSRQALHDALARALSFPEWYGKNLDALYDCLTDICQPTQLQLLNWKAAENTLGPYGRSAAETMLQASEDNPNLTVELLA